MTSVADFQAGVNDAEEAYEYMIAYAGQGIGREVRITQVDQIRQYLEQLVDGLEQAIEAAGKIPDEFSVDGEEYYEPVIEELERELIEAKDILNLLIQQERITSQQVDNLNGMSVFQSVLMKLFFLEEVTKHLDQ